MNKICVRIISMISYFPYMSLCFPTIGYCKAIQIKIAEMVWKWDEIMGFSKYYYFPQLKV